MKYNQNTHFNSDEYILLRLTTRSFSPICVYLDADKNNINAVPTIKTVKRRH